MPVRIYDISKKLGLDNKEILTKAKSLGIAAAKVPSSSLDKITAEYLEDEIRKDHPELTAAAPPVPAPAPVHPHEPIVVISAPPPGGRPCRPNPTPRPPPPNPPSPRPPRRPRKTPSRPPAQKSARKSVSFSSRRDQRRRRNPARNPPAPNCRQEPSAGLSRVGPNLSDAVTTGTFGAGLDRRATGIQRRRKASPASPPNRRLPNSHCPPTRKSSASSRRSSCVNWPSS